MALPFATLLLILPAAAPDAGRASPVTYTKQVAPILWKNCAGCHRPGEVGPFPLLTYKDAAKRASFLKDVVAERKMPPWHAEPGFGEFHDARRLDDREIALIARWADSGAPEGDPRDLPPPPKFSEGWQLGEPDVVLKLPEPFQVPASGRDVFRCFVIPTGVARSRTVAAVEFRPGNRRVVHHALLFLDAGGKARGKDAADPGPGYASFGGVGFPPSGSLGGWAPGAMPRPLPDGVGRLLPKNADLVLQVHYHPSGKPESDQSAVGIYFTKTPTSKILVTVPIINIWLHLPAGDPHRKVTARTTVPTDVHAIGITPHMHWLGKEMRVTATLPDGTTRPVIWVKDWDFNWQGNYQYEKPLALPKGTRLDLEAYYDNSDANPRNPNHPPKDVYFGEQTTDEMCLCGVQVVPDQPSGYVELLRARAARRLRRGQDEPQSPQRTQK
jgi:mono/diheme cytochrome c family protein